MAIIRESPRFYNAMTTAPIVTASSGFNLQFGFLASYVRIENYGTVDLWAKFNSTGAASTADIRIRTCEPARVFELHFNAPRGPAMISLAATSTTASGAGVFAFGEP